MKEFRDLMAELRDFPRLIHDAELAAEQYREEWNMDRVKRDYAFAAAFLRAKAQSVPETQAKHIATQAVFDQDKALVAAESKYRKAAADHMFLENKFNAARKIANMQEAALLKLGTIAD